MTLAVAIERRGRIWMGADSALKQGDYSVPCIEPKVWVSGNWIMAGAGPWRALNVVRHSVKMPRVPKPSEADRCVEIDVVRAIATVLDEAGIRHDLPESDDEDGATECGWLVGVQGLGVWKISDQTSQRVKNEAVIGCEEYADGWLDASPIANPELRIRECIKAASRRLPADVRLPIRMILPDPKVSA